MAMMFICLSELTSAIASASLGHARKVRELVESFDLVQESSSESQYWRRDEESAAVPRNSRRRRTWPQHLFVWLDMAMKRYIARRPRQQQYALIYLSESVSQVWHEVGHGN
jgi:hypothetical protein